MTKNSKFKDYSLNKIIVLFAILFISTTANSQITIDSLILKRGIYKTKEELLKNSPSILNPFSFTILSDTSSNGAIDFYSKGYNFNDSSKPINKVFGFCDGKYMYVRIYEYENLISPHKFYRLNQLGKFPFVSIRKSVTHLLYLPLGLMPIVTIGLAAETALNPQTDVWYFNKKGTFRLATEQSIFFLLKDDKDLTKQMGAERYKNSNILIKYLKLMNERYKW